MKRTRIVKVLTGLTLAGITLSFMPKLMVSAVVSQATATAFSLQNAIQIFTGSYGQKIIKIDTSDPNIAFEVVTAKDTYNGARETLKQMVDRKKALGGINTDYFGNTSPQGTTYVNGVFKGDLITSERNGCSRTSLGISASNVPSIGWCQSNFNVTGGGPKYLVNGEIVWHHNGSLLNGEYFPNTEGYWDSQTGQSGAGISADSKYLILGSAANVGANRITPGQMAETLKLYGAYNAIRFDGGGSAQLYYNGQYLVQSNEDRAVAAGLVFYYGRSSIGGFVKTIQGNIVPDAYVTFESGGVQKTTRSNASGVYSFEHIPSGPATIKAMDSSGINKVQILNVDIPNNFSKNFDILLSNQCVSSSSFSSLRVEGDVSVQSADCTPIGNPGGSCPNNRNGLYCGSSLGLNSGSLYNCQNGVTTLAQTCSNGCTVQPSGTDDFCAPASSGGSYCPNNQNGYYCGSSLGLDTNTLYSCQNGVKTASQTCSLGCIQKPAGTADVCRTSTSGGSCPAGNGDYCGGTLGLDPNTLFSCSNGNISVKQTCSNGCKLNPPGTPDACYPPGSGGGGSTGSKLILYGDSNYGANTIRVQVGIGDTDEPSRGAAYKSMSLPAGWSVILSDQHLGLVGNTKCFNQSQPLLESQGWAFSIESMRVFGTNVCPSAPADGVSICRNTGQSNCMMVGLDVPSLNNYGFGNDTLKSIQIGGSWEAVLFEDDGYGGRRWVASTNNDLGGIPFGYGASSIQVRRRDPAAFQLYHLGDYNDGNPFKSDRTIADLSFWDSVTAPDDQKWNDKAESIRVASGYEIVACTDSNFHGVCGRTNHDNGDLNSVAQGLRRGLSSIQVCQGSCAPTSVPPVLIAPENNSTYTPGTPMTLSWAGNGDQYLVEYWGGTFGSNVHSTGWRDDLTSAFTVMNLPASTNPYSWRVRSWTTVGESGWSPTYSFKISEPAPAQATVNGPTQVEINTDVTFTALASPSNAANLQYTWSPSPKSGQGTASAVYNWSTIGNQTISVTVQNGGGSANANLVVSTHGPAVAPILAQIPGQTIAQGGTFRTINLNSYVTNLAQQSGLSWEISGDDKLFVVIVGNIATIKQPVNWSGREDITFTARNSSNQTASSTVAFIVNGPVICPVGQFKAEYFANTTLTGTPAMSRCETDINNDWGYESPDPMLNADSFSARWTMTLPVTDQNSRYTFSITGDDGVRLYVDNVLVSDGWYDHGEITYVTAQDLSVGNHVIKMEYYENAGAAVAKLNWQFNHIPVMTQIPGQTIFKGESFSTIDLSNYASDQDNQPLSWDYWGNSVINVSIIGNIATLTYPSDWTGSEAITFAAIDPEFASSSTTASFAVVSPFTCPPGQYYAYYFNNMDMSGVPAVTRCETAIKHSWSTAAPAVGVSANNFSARWTNTLNVPVAGTYSFTTVSDDGVRLYVDDVLVIDHWLAHTAATDKVSLYLGAGDHAIKMEYYEKTAYATAILNILLVNKPPVIKAIPGQTIYQAQSFKPINLNLYATDPDAGDQITWSVAGNTNIAVNIDSNNMATLSFPYIWKGYETLTFKATDKYGASISTKATFRVNIIPSCPLGQYKAQYFNNMTLTGIPAFTRCEDTPQYDWAGDSPLPGINADNFSVRWIGSIRFLKAGYYRFTTTSDDGLRLYVDGVLGINNWTDHSSTENVYAKYLSAAYHQVRIDYYENGGDAVAKLSHTGPGNKPVINPIPVQTINAGQSFNAIDLNSFISDLDLDDRYAWTITAPSTLLTTYVDGGYLNVITPFNWIGTDYVTLKLTDSYGLINTVKITFKSSNVGSCAPGLGNYCVDYYNNPYLWGDPFYTATETSIYHYWGLNAPITTMPKDYFSARWQGNIKLAAGTRKFTVVSDNGVRLYVDGNLVIDNWNSHTTKTDVATLYMTAGYHLIQMEYYEETGAAIARLSIL